MYKTPNKYYEDNHKENSKLSFKAFQKDQILAGCTRSQRKPIRDISFPP